MDILNKLFWKFLLAGPQDLYRAAGACCSMVVLGGMGLGGFGWLILDKLRRRR